MRFNYQARTRTGEIQSGVVEAASKEAAMELLKSYHLYVTSLEEETPPLYARRIRFFERIPKKEKVVLARQLAILFKSEVPLVEMFQTLAKQTENPNLRERIIDIGKRVEGGLSLSKAFAAHPQIFTPFYINMIRAGEIAGKLAESFAYLADHLEREYIFSQRVKGALIYPALVFFVLLVVAAIMVFFVIPQFNQVLVQAEVELPLITKAVLAMADFVRKQGWLLLLLFIFLIVSIYYYYKTEPGKKFFDRKILNLPLIGDLAKKNYLVSFASNLSTLISSGLPIAQALEVTSEVIGNDVYRSIIAETSEWVKRGEPISSVLQWYPDIISPLFTQMVIVGEKTGTLDTSLMNVVEFYQKEVDRTLENIISLLTPIVIIFLGILVAGLMASVLLPLYSRLVL